MNFLNPDLTGVRAPWFLPRTRIAADIIRRHINKYLPGGREPEKIVPDYLKKDYK